MDVTSLVNTSTLAGWVRAAVAAGLGALIARWPELSSVMDPTTQTAIGTVAAGLVVGVWSHLAKATATPPSKP